MKLKNQKIRRYVKAKPQKFIGLAVVVLIFSTLGTITLLKTPAASVPSVRFVQFCSIDSCNGSLSEITDRGKKVRTWYKNQLGGGHTFRMLKTTRITGGHTASYYRGSASGKDAISNSILSKLHEAIYEERNVKTVVTLGFSTNGGHCGASDQDGISGYNYLATIDPFICKSFVTTVVAHEMSHTFGLGHTTDGTLMNSLAPCDFRGLSNCRIESSQKSWLLSSRGAWFPNASSASIETDPDVEPYVDVSYSNEGAVWTGWESMAGQTYSAPDSVSRGENMIDIFVRGTDNLAYIKYWNGSGWYGWQSLGGGTYSAPAATTWGPSRLDLFVRGTDNHIYTNPYDGVWHGWQGLGGNTYAAPAAVSWGAGRIDVVIRNTDNQVYHKWYQNGWSNWESLGCCAYDVSVSSWAPGRLDVFIRGTDNNVYHKWYNNSTWSGWEAMAGSTYSAPAVVSWDYNSIDLAVIGTDHNVYHKWWDGSAWSGWENVGCCGYNVGLSSWSPGRLDLFIQGTDNNVYHKSYGP